MKLKNNILILIFISIAIIIGGYFITSFVYPKNAGRYPIFVVILILDIYLWFSIKKLISNLFSVLKYLIFIIYWFPLTIMILYMGISVFIPITTWNPAFRTYLFGIVFTIVVAKLFPIFLLIIDDVIRLFKVFVFFIKKKYF